MADLRSSVALGLVVERLERRDIEGALDGLNLDRVAYAPLSEVVQRAYTGGGQAAVGGMPALRDPKSGQAVIRFDVKALRAAEYIRAHGVDLATRLSDQDRAAARTMIADGFARGRGARSVGLDVAGRTKGQPVVVLVAKDTTNACQMQNMFAINTTDVGQRRGKHRALAQRHD